MVPGVVFVGSTDGIFMALDAATGQVLWLFPAIGAVSSGAAVSDGEVFVGAGTTAVSYMLGQGPINGLFAFALPASPPELPGPPELPPAMWPLGVLEYPVPADGTTPAPTPTPST
jgi:outer membrane protein assembly factor BamB